MPTMKLFLTLVLCTSAFACTAPTNLAAVAKGPTQINLTWTAASVPCYGYIVEVVSTSDARYPGYVEFQPIPTAGGFQCNPAIVINAHTCTYDDLALAHVYNPVANYLPTWVTEAQYTDPTDGSAKQVAIPRLLNNTQYSFRVKTCTGQTASSCSGYSTVATVTTPNYTVRYISPSGNNTTGDSPTNAWTTLSTGSSHMACGTILVVLAGNYTLGDKIVRDLTCTANSRAVIQFQPGAAIDFPIDGSQVSVLLGTQSTGGGDFFVLDGVKTRWVGTWDTNGSKPWEIWSDHTALLGVEFSVEPTNIPSAAYGIWLRNAHTLMVSSYLHHVGTPDDHQVGNGATGFPLAMRGDGVFENNHITGGGHDTGTCITDNGGSVVGICAGNRYLNNVLDGGWGHGVITGTQAPTGNMLVEGNFILDPGYYLTQYQGQTGTGSSKSCFQSGGPNTTIRRNRCVVNGYTVRLVEFTSSCNGDPLCSVANVRLYSNVIYSPSGTARRALYESGTNSSQYSGVVIADNIISGIYCDTVNNVFLLEGYLKTGLHTHNLLRMAGGNSACFTSKIISWNLNNINSDCSYCGNPQTIATFESDSPTQWIGNDALSGSDPQYVDAAAYDFHLAPGSPLIGAGVHVVDSNYTNPSTATAPDLGAFGLVPPAITPSGGGASVSSATRISSRTSH